MKIFILIFIFGIMSILPCQAGDDTYYVRPEGTDYGTENGKSYANAWEGLTAVQWDSSENADKVDPGDTLYICGCHAAEKTSTSQLTSVHDITPAAGTSENARVTLRGDCSSVDASYEDGYLWGAWKNSIGGDYAWQSYGDGIYYCTIPILIYSAFAFYGVGSPNPENYTRLTRRDSLAALQAASEGYTSPSRSTFLDNGGQAVDAGGGAVTLPCTGHEFLVDTQVFIEGTENYDDSYYILSVTADTFNITATYAEETFDGTETVENRYVASNGANYGSGEPFYVKISGGGDPGGNIYFTSQGYGYQFLMEDKHYMSFINLDFLGVDSMFYEDSQYRKYQGCNFFYASYTPLLALRNGSDYFEVINCEFAYGSSGIYTYYYTHLPEPTSPYYGTIRGNYFHHIGTEPGNENGDAHAIGFQNGDGHLVENNIIDGAGTGITLYVSTQTGDFKNTIVRYNYVANGHELGGANSRGIECGGGVAGGDQTGNVIYGNIVDSWVTGLRPDIKDEIKVYNNTILNCTNGIKGHMNTGGIGPNHYLRNNIFYNNTYHVFWDSGASTYTIDYDYNTYYPDTGTRFLKSGYKNFAQWQALVESGNTFDPNSSVGDPLFVDAENDDLHLLLGSPCIDTGLDLGSPYNIDYDGEDQDSYGAGWEIGAYAFTSSARILLNGLIQGGTLQ